MKHQISLTTIEAMLINKALGMDMHNDTDNEMADVLEDRINKVVEYDLQDNRCENCVNYVQNQGRSRSRGQCMLKSGYSYKDIRYGKTKACKKYFELKEKTDD